MESKIGLYGLTVGPFGTNCYILLNKENNEIVLVDPGDNGAGILRECEKIGGHVTAILLTHGHWDHTSGIKAIKEVLPDVPLYAAEKELPLLKDDSLNAGMGRHADLLLPDITVRDEEEITPTGIRMKVYETPGHTAGSVCYYIREENLLLAGDTLFKGSYGRCDLPTGSDEEMRKSLKRLAAVLPDETDVLPGHGPVTSMAYEKKYNPGI